MELVHDTPPYTFTAHVVQAAAAYVTMYTCMTFLFSYRLLSCCPTLVSLKLTTTSDHHRQT
jgi:hypothetical protein